MSCEVGQWDDTISIVQTQVPSGRQITGRDAAKRSPCKLTFDLIELRRSVTSNPPKMSCETRQTKVPSGRQNTGRDEAKRNPCKLTFDLIELRRSVTTPSPQFWSKPRGEQIYLLSRGAAQNVLRQQDKGAMADFQLFLKQKKRKQSNPDKKSLLKMD